MGKAVKLDLRVKEISAAAREVKTFRFTLPGGDLPEHLPGQFMRITIPVASQGLPQTSRSFTIASSPTEKGFYQLTVKRNPQGVVSNFLHRELQPGASLAAKAPLGDFVFQEGSAARIALIGGGSGITPLRSILRYIADRDLPVEARLLYYNSEEPDIIFGPELERLGQRPRFQVHLALTRPTPGWPNLRGRIEPPHLDRLLGDFDPELVYLCGPPPLMDRARALLGQRGIAEQQILSELFH
jgi:ferredoxin-NADP reductase